MNRLRKVVNVSNEGFRDISGGITYDAQIAVNGVSKSFNLRQPFYRSLLVTIAHVLGRKASYADLRAIATVTIREWVSNGNLDDWPASLPLTLPAVHYRNVEALLHKAGLICS